MWASCYSKHSMYTNSSDFHSSPIRQLLFFFFKIIFWLCYTACGILVNWPGIKPMPPALAVWSLHYHHQGSSQLILLSPFSVQFSPSVESDSLKHHGLQHARLPCLSPSPRVYSNSCSSSHWCHPTISSSVIPFSSCPQSTPTSGSFPMSQFFILGGQSIGASA